MDSGKVYVGSSVDMKDRISSHRVALKKNRHPNKILQRSWNKYGEKSFSFQCLIICAPSDRVMYEQICIDHYKSYDRKNGFNIRKKAETNAGLKWSSTRRDKQTKIFTSQEYLQKVLINKPGDVYNGITLLNLICTAGDKNSGKWHARCHCGREYCVSSYSLRKNISKSCGCIKQKLGRNNAGLTKTKEYRAWRSIKRTGAMICDRWLEFKNFLEDMGPSPNTSKLRLINKTLGYTPENCKWVSKGDTLWANRVKLVMLEGHTISVSAAERRLGLANGGVYTRAKRRNESHQTVVDYFFKKGKNATK